MAAKTAPTPPKTKPAYLKDLILLFSIPAAIAIIAALAVYVPRWLANPKYDFIYAVCDNYSCDDSYRVNDAGQVNQNLRATTLNLNNMNSSASWSQPDQDFPALRYYDVRTDSSRAISITEAQRYTLDTSSRSPDGYVLTDSYSDSGFLFWSSSDSGWYLKNGSKKQKVELSSSTRYGYSSDQITFLGWVKQ